MSNSNIVEVSMETGSDTLAQGIELKSGISNKIVIKRSKTPQNLRKPGRILFWNIRELGGGLYMPESRPDYCIDAYVDLIKYLNIDICILAGIKETTGQGIEVKQLKDGTSYLDYTPVPEDTGIKEVERILDSLKKSDAGAGWKLGMMRSDDEGNPVVYLNGSTACFLYRSAKDVELTDLYLAQANPGLERLDISRVLLCAAFRMAEQEKGYRPEVHILTPMDTQTDGSPASGVPKSVEVKPRLPQDPFVFAVSTPLDLLTDLGALQKQGVRGTRQYQEMPYPWSVPGELPWEEYVNSGRTLVNFLAINPVDVRLQDEGMHWEALDLPQHPESFNQLSGQLSDLLATGNPVTGDRVQLSDLQVVNLVRAALPERILTRMKKVKKTASSGRNSGQGVPIPPESLPEDGILASYLQKRKDSANYPATSDQPDDLANLLAESLDFSRLLSDHWPVVAAMEFIGGIQNAQKGKT
jgi:hypothetical protein